MSPRVHIWPSFAGEDTGDGGVRRVVEGQIASLPAHGWEVVDDPADADVIASHITIPRTYLTRFPDKPIVSMCHGMYWFGYEWDNWCLKANADVMEAIRVADIVTAPTEWVAQAIRRASCRDVRVVPHGVDADLWAPIDQNDGYIIWGKSRPDAICDPEPMNIVAEKLRNLRFVSTFGREAPNVTLTGRRSYAEMKDLIRRAGAYLCTARETFGIQTLEAMAAGVPIVGWDWGGQAEFIEHGVDGWLAAPGDHAALAEGVLWALENREAISPRAIAKARTFTWDRAGKMYADIYAEAVERRSGYQLGSKVTSPKVSVIVPAFNLDKWLPETLDSVLAQSMSDWECIIVDDASPDRCGAIAEEFAARDSRFRVIHNEENRYLAASRNIAIEASRGRYVMPLDADDMLTPDALEILTHALDVDRTIHVAYGGMEFLEPDGERWHSGWPMDFDHRNQLMQRNLLPYCSMFRREVWELLGGYRERFRTAEDADFWCRASSYGFRPRRVTTQDCVVYRNRDDSMSRKESPRDWTAWFPWSHDPALTPAGAAAEQQLPVPSLDPVGVSVVIPCGPGHARLLMDAIDSVDAQTYRLWECIVVNDTGEPLPRLPSWVRIVEPFPADTDTGGYRGRFGGAAAARNAGIAAAKAPLFLPLDADDILQPEALEFMLAARAASMGDKPGAGPAGDIIYSDFWEDPEDAGTFRIWECPDYEASLLIKRGAVHCVTALTPVATWKAVGGYDETLPGWEDWGFQIACAELGICSRRVKAPLLLYRKHTGARREQNQEAFDESKAGILSKYGRYWNGDTLMGCGSCGQRRTIDPRPQGSSYQGPGAQPQGAVLIRYEGAASGAQTYRGEATGTAYRFGAGEEKYIYEEDLDKFMRLPGFVLLKGSRGRSVEAGAPELTGAMPPRGDTPESAPEPEHAELELPPALPISTPGMGPADPTRAAIEASERPGPVGDQPSVADDGDAIEVGATEHLSFEQVEARAIAQARSKAGAAVAVAEPEEGSERDGTEVQSQGDE